MSSLPDQPLPEVESFDLDSSHLTSGNQKRREQISEPEMSALNDRKWHQHRLLDAIPQIVWTTDPTGTVTYLNRYWYTYTGLSEAESVTGGVLNRLHPDDRATVIAGWQRALVDRVNYETECRLLRADGTYHWFMVQGVAVTDEQKQVVEWVGTATEIDQRKHAEDALRQSEQKLSLQVQKTPFGVIEWTLDFTVADWNPAATTIFEYSREEAIGRHAAGLLVPESARAYVDQLWNDLLQNRGGTRSTNNNFTKTGRSIVCEWHNTPLIDSTGQVLGVVSLVRDVTDQHQAEAEVRALKTELERRVVDRTAQLEAANDTNEALLLREQVARVEAGALTRSRDETLQALRRSEERYRSLVIATSQIIWTTGANGEFITEQPGWTAFTGQSFADLQGSGWLNAIHPDDRAHTVEAWATALANQTLCEVEHRLRRHDGEYRYMQARAVPILEADQRIREWVGIHIDQTEKKQAETALEAQKAFLKAVINADLNLIFVKDWQGKFVLVNQALADVYGAPIADIIGKTDADFNTNPEEVQRYLQDDREVMTSLQPKFITEESVTAADGGTRWFQTFKMPLIEPNGCATQILGVAVDITDRKRAETNLQARADELARTTTLLAKTASNLEKRNQELDQFAYAVSHDLKAPLRAIANLSQWIEEDLDEHLNDDTRHQMNLLRGRVHRMEALIDGLLQYSRIGRIEGQIEVVSVEALLQEVIDLLAPPAEFTIDIAPHMPTLRTDRLRLQQVFANLIGNAIKHHPRSDGVVRVTVQARGDRYEFAVADDGQGIDPAYHEKIFGIFQTLEARDKVENTGIGLSLVKKIVENRGGTIHLDSQPGEGAVFRFTWS